MLPRLWLIGGFGLLLALLWAVSMHLTPHKGLLKGLDRVCIGMILCYCAGLLLRPFGLHLPGGLVPSAAAGALGLPGAVLCWLIGSGL